MIRQAIRLAIEAAKVEVQRLRERPAPPPVETPPPPAPEPAPAATTRRSPWASSAYHVQVLASTACPYCSEGKPAGEYFCARCRSAA